MSGFSKPLPIERQGEASAPLEHAHAGLSREAWARIAVVSALMIAVFWPSLRRLWFKTAPFVGEANWQHALFVPLIGLYYLYLNRESLLKAPVRPLLWDRFARPGRLGIGLAIAASGALGWVLFRSEEWILRGFQGLLVYGLFVISLDWGLGTTLFGLFVYAFGIWPGQNDFVKDIGLVITLFGVVTALCGWEVMKTAWFPIVFLVCALPWPQLAYTRVAMPLQQLAASAAAGTLRATGVDAYRTGTKLVIGTGNSQRILNVAEACAGLKSLMTFVAVAAAVGFLSSRPLWQKLLITLSAIPIAIFCNMLRVSGQGLLDHYVDRRLSESFAHQFVGLVMLIPAFFLIQLVAWILDNLFVEEVDRRVLSGGSGAVPATGLPGAATAKPTALTEQLAAATERLQAASLRSRPVARNRPVNQPPASSAPQPRSDSA